MRLFLSKLQKVVLGKVKSKMWKVESSREAGITLLLAILILSSVLAISFSLATIMFVEVRSSGDLLKTEPALYAATGVSEQAFFNLERSACAAGGGDCYTTNFSNNVRMPTAPIIVTSSTPIFIDKVKTGSNFPNQLNNYYFCTLNPGSNPNGTAAGCNYGKVTVSYITTNGSSNPLYAYLCQFDPNGNYSTLPCSQVNDLIHGTDQGYWNNTGGTLNNDGSVTMYSSNNSSVSWILDPTKQQQLILTNPGSTGDIYVKISTYDQNCTAGNQDCVGKGLPYVGKTAVAINTLNAAVGRKIQVVVPNLSSFGSSGGATGSGTGTVVLQKNTLGGDGTFNFIATGDSSLPASPSITTSGGAGSQTFNNVKAGSYSISESLPVGWSLNSASCNDGSSSYSFPTVSNINVTAGATVACAFSDSKVAGFLHYRTITVNSGQVPSTQNYFPVLVSGTYSYLRSADNGGEVQSPSGTDIKFTDSGGNLLPYEQEKYVAVTGEIEYWVQLPSISNGTVFRMYYDNAGATDQSNKTGVWDSNYKGVWHFPNGTTFGLNDSTSNGNNMANPTGQITATSGAIDGGAGSFGANHYLGIASLNGGSSVTSATLSAWIYESGTASGKNILVANGARAGLFTSYATSQLTFMWNNTGDEYSATTGLNIPTGSWHYAVVVITPTVATVYLDTSSWTNTKTYNSKDLSGDWWIGNDSSDPSSRGWNGSLDEVRISTTVRSADWIRTEYNNQLNPSAFVRVEIGQ